MEKARDFLILLLEIKVAIPALFWGKGGGIGEVNLSIGGNCKVINEVNGLTIICPSGQDGNLAGGLVNLDESNMNITENEISVGIKGPTDWSAPGVRPLSHRLVWVDLDNFTKVSEGEHFTISVESNSF
jgi:hypothetical protein